MGSRFVPGAPETPAISNASCLGQYFAKDVPVTPNCLFIPTSYIKDVWVREHIRTYAIVSVQKYGGLLLIFMKMRVNRSHMIRCVPRMEDGKKY